MGFEQKTPDGGDSWKDVYEADNLHDSAARSHSQERRFRNMIKIASRAVLSWFIFECIII